MMLFSHIMLAVCYIAVSCVFISASYFEVTACHDNTSSLITNKNKPRVVDVFTGSVVHLWCNFCEAKQDYFPKLWYYKPRGNKVLRKEIVTETDDCKPKIAVTPTHILNIYNFNVNNTGIYTCKSSTVENKFIYVLEALINDLSPKIGTSSQWQEYKRFYIDPINNRFKISQEELFKSLRHDLNITFKLTTVWENWGECKGIDQEKGVRKRLGRCRLQANTPNGTIEEVPISKLNNSEVASYFTDGYDIPCRSLQLTKIVPEISDMIRSIPDYEAEEICHVLKRSAKPKINNKEKSKHRTTKQVAENSHVTLLCSEVISNSDLRWFKDEKLLNSLFRNNIICKNEEEPHISVDSNNSLHILHISKNEEGNYSCLVNGKKVQEFEVTVVSKSKLLNQEFIRYSIYLGFVLSLAMACYCAGVCVAWHRRASFVDPLNINKKGNHENNRLQCEREKLLK